MNNKIKAGDQFKFKGDMHNIQICIGTDEGLVWANSEEIMGTIGYDPNDCDTISTQDEVYNEQKLQPYH